MTAATTCGSVNSTCPGSRSPKRICNTSRTTMMARPKRRNEPNVRPHGARGRRAATTSHATATRSASSSGSVVRNAAVPSASAQIHHASGWSERGLTTAPGSGAGPRTRPRRRARRTRTTPAIGADRASRPTSAVPAGPRLPSRHERRSLVDGRVGACSSSIRRGASSCSSPRTLDGGSSVCVDAVGLGFRRRGRRAGRSWSRRRASSPCSRR